MLPYSTLLYSPISASSNHHQRGCHWRFVRANVETHRQTEAEGEPKLETLMGPLTLKLREPIGRWEEEIRKSESDVGHQKNIIHRLQ